MGGEWREQWQPKILVPIITFNSLLKIIKHNCNNNKMAYTAKDPCPPMAFSVSKRNKMVLV